ncbi:hypothetical protein ACCO45_010660 [Purpureocillium lilacinum]|uniref:Uncharacterized protein n=1 Tax=Purpureocillium lilacinum TaxID=33203 RepID=A0ACC4DH10_PURLI
MAARVRASGPKQCCVDGELGGVRCIGRADEGHSCRTDVPCGCVEGLECVQVSKKYKIPGVCQVPKAKASPSGGGGQ